MSETASCPKVEQPDFLVTKEYRRFAEFCKACQRERYIGLCYGPPGVGKTLSARYYTQWHLLEHRLPPDRPYLPLPQEIAECRALFYTPEVINSAKRVYTDIKAMRAMFNRFVEELIYPPCDNMPTNTPEDYCKLLIVDEADRLKMAALEQLRDFYDRGGMGLVFIGMPGLEKRMSRYPQLYSRIGFAHKFQPLSSQEVRFILEYHWERLGLKLDTADFTDSEAVAAVVRITGGNFRLIHRLFAQIRRILELNNLSSISSEVVEAARECLVIGTT